MPAIPMTASVGEEGSERALTRLCVALGGGERWPVRFGRGPFEIVGLDVVQERFAGAHDNGQGPLLTRALCLYTTRRLFGSSPHSLSKPRSFIHPCFIFLQIVLLASTP